MVTIFNTFGLGSLKITIVTNLTTDDFVDVTLDMGPRIFMPSHKTNKKLLYYHRLLSSHYNLQKSSEWYKQERLETIL